MNLSLDHINSQSPYQISESGGGLLFETENGVRYRVNFTEEYPIGGCETFQFMFSKLTTVHTSFDNNISRTLVLIIEEFFRVNHDVLLYICDTSDKREASRNRLFTHWFRQFSEDSAFEFRSASSHVEYEKFFAAIIVERTNPKLEAVLEDFDKTAKELNK